MLSILTWKSVSWSTYSQPTKIRPSLIPAKNPKVPLLLPTEMLPPPVTRSLHTIPWRTVGGPSSPLGAAQGRAPPPFTQDRKASLEGMEEELGPTSRSLPRRLRRNSPAAGEERSTASAAEGTAGSIPEADGLPARSRPERTAIPKTLVPFLIGYLASKPEPPSNPAVDEKGAP